MRNLSSLTACLVLWNGLSFSPTSHRLSFGRPINSSTQLMAYGRFDLSKPVFDVFTCRSIRGDALLRYNSLNQSEPLRINLYAILALGLFSFPTISEAIGLGDSLSVLQTGLCGVGGLGSIGLFVRECSRRSNQLYRIEKELNSESLKLRLPMNVLSDSPYTDPISFGMLIKGASQNNVGVQILVISGTALQLSSVLTKLKVFGQRFKQAKTFVVPVPTDGSTRKDWNLGKEPIRSPPWLADAYELSSWLQYLDDLSDDSSQFRWFGMNSNGRSFGSGIGEEPQWLELFGRFMRPRVILDERNDCIVTDETRDVLDAQAKFYNCLTTGDVEGMTFICFQEGSPAVTKVLEAGGRLDDWNECLKDDARPADMKISGADAILVTESKAYSTVIEFPQNEGTNVSLLAVQEWFRPSIDDEWKLVLHQTIPWTFDRKAQGTLRCDCRGCIALTSGTGKRLLGNILA